MNKKIAIIIFGAIILSASNFCFGQTISLKSLLNEMTDRGSIARYPYPEFKCKQMSSYDRMSVAPDKPGWFANMDLTNFLGVDTVSGRREFIIFDHKGPGAIVRFWMTFAGVKPGEGKMRIYIDENPQPVAEGTPFDLLSGGILAPEPLSSSVSKDYRYDRRGHNLYLPIPYSNNCKITYESENVKGNAAGFAGEIVYYNINYREYPKGSDVVSFSKEELFNNRALIETTSKKLSENIPLSENKPITLTQFSLNKNGEYSEIFNGEGCINGITIKLDAANINQALRSVVVEIYFDGQLRVWSPVGDFFGTGYKICPQKTFYTLVESNGTMCCYWIMPYRKDAKVVIKNYSYFPVNGLIKIEKGEWKWDASSMYFGASWKEYYKLDAGGVKSNTELGVGAFDVNYVKLDGKGVYVGDVLTLYNSAYAWWGEGDEKIYVDGETFPSHFGTGSEDYYGYAWSRPEKFTDHPFIGQPDGSGNLEAGYTVNLRYRALDKIPFTSSLDFDMEVWTWTDAILNYSPTTFYYLLPGFKGATLPDIKGVRNQVAIDRRDLVPAIVKKGKFEFDQLYFDKNHKGRISFDRSVNYTTSNKAFVNWSGTAKGDSLTVLFYSKEDVKVSMVLATVKGQNFGTFRLLLNGKPLGETSGKIIDGFSADPGVVENDLGFVKLDKGENRMTLINEGPHSNEQKNSFIGIDYIIFK